MTTTPLVNLSPLPLLAAGVLLLAALPLAWWWWRHRQATWPQRLAALTALTLFLTLDLVVFGAFTRLSDSGLGCPDWPGCYGQASPLGAKAAIAQAQAALPSGPVTHGKAWVEMVHRYLAMTVGVLILLSAVLAWRARRSLPQSPWWATATLAWVLVQGLFGKYTVTLKLYPAIVTLHLLGGLVLVALLVVQHEQHRARPLAAAAVSARAVGLVLALLAVQITLGGWVSTNYAVLACQGFPACNGQWWPAMDAGQGFTVLRELGRAGQGGYLPFEALVAIHMAHRLFALVAAGALGWLAWRLGRSRSADQQRLGRLLAGLLLLQLASGLSNVVLGWPLLAALMHSAGAALLVAFLVSLLSRLLLSQQPRVAAPSWATVPRPEGRGDAASAAQQPAFR